MANNINNNNNKIALVVISFCFPESKLEDDRGVQAMLESPLPLIFVIRADDVQGFLVAEVTVDDGSETHTVWPPPVPKDLKGSTKLTNWPKSAKIEVFVCKRFGKVMELAGTPLSVLRARKNTRVVFISDEGPDVKPHLRCLAAREGFGWQPDTNHLLHNSGRHVGHTNPAPLSYATWDDTSGEIVPLDPSRPSRHGKLIGQVANPDGAIAGADLHGWVPKPNGEQHWRAIMLVCHAEQGAKGQGPVFHEKCCAWLDERSDQEVIAQMGDWLPAIMRELGVQMRPSDVPQYLKKE